MTDSVQSNPPPALTRAQTLLLDFLSDHDACCPSCGYNVRALTRPVCPECRQQLTLTVGVVNLRLGWLLVALAPGFFSGIAACFVLIPLGGQLLFNNYVDPLLAGLDLFGWSSGFFAILLAWKRHRFLALSRGRQVCLAAAIWFVHVAAFVIFLTLAIRGW